MKVRFLCTPFFAADASVNAGTDHLLAALRLDPAHAVVVGGAGPGLARANLSQLGHNGQLVSDGSDLGGQSRT